MITGSGRVSLLLGPIRRHRVGLPALHECAPVVHWAAAPAGWAEQAAHGRRGPARPSREFGPKALGN
jgi:hypothetical protein